MKISVNTALVALLASVFLSLPASGNESPPPKRPLAHTDFDSWRTIATPTLSRDGKWLAYSVQPQDGDGELVIREVATNRERREGVGALPPPVTTPNEENPEAPPTPRAIQVRFSSDNRFVIATTHPTKAEIAAARKAKRKPDEMPRGGLLIVDLQATNETPAVRIANVKSMQVPSKGGAWLAYLKEEVKEPAKPAPSTASKPETPAKADGDLLDEVQDDDQTRRTPPAASASAANASGASAASARKETGTELVLRNLASGEERSFANVLEFSLARDGKALLYTVASKAETYNGVYAVATGSTDAPRALLSGKGKYVKLTWDREQTQAAFMSDRDDANAKQPSYKAYLWKRDQPTNSVEATPLAPLNVKPPNGMVVSDKATLGFSRDGKKLYLGVAPPPKPPRDTDAAPPDEERVVADLWRWNDDVVQPIQRVRAVQERNRTYRGVFDIASARYTQLADETLATISLSDSGERAIGLDDRGYRRLRDFEGAASDVYLLDTTTGQRKLILKKQRDLGGGGGGASNALWSPDGKWVLSFRDQHWHLLDTATGASKRITSTIPRAFFNEEQDTPGPKGSYGTAGWLSDSSSVLLYDRFDIWQVFADARAPRNLTQDAGRNSKIRLRVQSIEPIDPDDDERGINPQKALTLRGESLETRATGFYVSRFEGNVKPERLLWQDANMRFVVRAQEADALLITTSRFDRFPELQVTSSRFENPRALTTVGSQMQRFTWGTSELMSFRNARGVALKATVIKPDGFDAKKKYPLMVYIYERVSQNVHNFSNPTPSNIVNPALYVSNGYVMLLPDIVYTQGAPGKDALDAVMPAIDALVKQGFIDEKAIGIQGHSWGGYQIAWMVTQTNRFRAAGAGAPVGNMTSAYSGIRWGSGLPRQFQYEQGQSRIGKNMIDARAAYVAASPVFFLNKVTTPLLILANDADDAVPWYQGIELFLGLRRLGKEAYLFNYNNQLHNLRRRADQKDFALRMHQYFDHFLKGAPAPEWMTKGIPFNDREEEKERFNARR